LRVRVEGCVSRLRVVERALLRPRLLWMYDHFLSMRACASLSMLVGSPALPKPAIDSTLETP
jgi:hypothetical protein